jgi:hypothetical protein
MRDPANLVEFDNLKSWFYTGVGKAGDGATRGRMFPGFSQKKILQKPLDTILHP